MSCWHTTGDFFINDGFCTQVFTWNWWFLHVHNKLFTWYINCSFTCILLPTTCTVILNSCNFTIWDQFCFLSIKTIFDKWPTFKVFSPNWRSKCCCHPVFYVAVHVFGLYLKASNNTFLIWSKNLSCSDDKLLTSSHTMKLYSCRKTTCNEIV